MGKLVGLWTLVVLLIASVAAPAGATKPPKLVLVYGDSLTWESAWTLQKPGWDVVLKAFPGTAPCDWLGTLAGDVAAYKPQAVELETAGDPVSPCMQGDAIDSAPYLAKFNADIGTFFATVTAAHVPMVFVESPPMPDPTWNAAVTSIDQMAVTHAAQYHGVSIATTPRKKVTLRGAYVDYMKCLKSETAAQGCVAGQIAVRSLVATRGHFCPTGLPSTLPFECAEYSSGEWRYGTAELKAVMHPPKPVLP